jgi:hypothetical protein
MQSGARQMTSTWLIGQSRREESKYNQEFAIIDLDGPILGWAVGAGWFKYIPIFPKIESVRTPEWANSLPCLM